MIPGPQPFSLHLERPLGAGLRPGGLVSVQVLERLGTGRWLVSVRGRTIAVAAEVELAAGERFLARVLPGPGRVALRVLQPIERAPGEAAAALPADRVAAAFLAAGLSPRPEAVQKVRRLLERLRLPAEDFARLAAMLQDKGVDLDSPGVAALLADLGYGRGGGRRRRQAASRPSGPGELAQQLQQDLQNTGDGRTGALPLFNHLQPRLEQWFVIPYSYGEISGTIRLRRLAPALQADRLVLATDGRWSFVLDRKEAGFRLRALCSGGPPHPRARRGWRRLAQKLQNLGVETDDTIRGDDGFDGFFLPGEAGPHRRVDTEG
jgi:hypothetical protein